MRKTTQALLLSAVVLASLPAGAAAPRTLNVPGDYPSIQAAVNAAHSGDTVLIGAGHYREAVEVSTGGITIRGVDRNKVLIDGEFKRTNGILVDEADDVTVENLTVCCHTKNGVLWSDVKGYEGRYLTAYNNGDYGIFAYDSSGPALWEHMYGSGHPDSAFYIGECNPCDAVVTDVLSERNGLGWSGTNASGVTIKNSEFRLNALGIVPNSLNAEELPPATGGQIINNNVHDNGKTDVPGTSSFGNFSGAGIVLVGTVGTVVKDNIVKNNGLAGIIVVTYIDQDPGADQWLPSENKVTDNKVGPGHSVADLALGSFVKPGNCFDGNTGANGAPTEAPAGLQSSGLWSCSNPTTPIGSPQVEIEVIQQAISDPRTVDYKTMPKPPAQPTMPGVGTNAPSVAGKRIANPATAATGVGTPVFLAVLVIAIALLISIWLGDDGRMRRRVFRSHR